MPMCLLAVVAFLFLKNKNRWRGRVVVERFMGEEKGRWMRQRGARVQQLRERKKRRKRRRMRKCYVAVYYVKIFLNLS